VKTLRRKLVRDIGRSRPQFIAVIVTVFLGITMFGASYDSFRNLENSYDQTALDFRFANLTAVGGDPAAFAATAAAEPGVESVTIRTVADVPFRVGDAKFLGRAVGLPAAGEPDVNRVLVLRGDYLPGDGSGVLVERHMADHFGLEPGGRVELLGPGGWETFTVAGVIASPEYIWPARDRQEIITTPDNFGVVFATNAVTERLAGVAGPNEAVVFYRDGEADDDLTEELAVTATGLGASDAYTRAEQASNAGLQEDLKGFEELSLFFPILFLSAAAMAAYVMINRLVHAQRPQIGILLANGFTRRQVLGHYLGYGIFAGVVGTIPGIIAGALLGRLITGLYTDFIAVPVTVIRLYPDTFFAALFLGIGATALAALAPALSASRVTPAAAMRGETPAGRGKPSLIERLVPPFRRLPIRWRMALRGIERSPRRTLYTMLGVVLSLMLILVSWGMIDTVTALIDRQFVEIQAEDARVYFTGPVDTAAVDALTAQPGVAAAEPSLELPVTVSSATGSYSSALVTLEANTRMHRFITPDGSRFDLPESGIVAGVSMRDLLDIEVGDTVTVLVADFGVSFDETVSAFVDEPLGTLVYQSRERTEALAGTVLPATSALLQYEAGADGDTVRAALTDLEQIAAVEDTKALYDTVQEYLSLFYVFVGVMLVFGGAMAFALIFNAMSVNIAERRREVGTLLAVGAERRTISRLITAENLLVAAMGIPFGLVAGYWISSVAMASFSSDLFSFDLQMRTSTLVWSALAILVVALISQWPGLRAVRRLNIPRIVKERST
jgi:putative ABC transport system permease protein